MAPGEKCEVFKKVWVDVAPHERTVWKCLDKPEKKTKKVKKAKKAKQAKPAKSPKEKKSKPAKAAKPAKSPKPVKSAKPAKQKAKKSKPAKQKAKKSKPAKKPKAKGNAPITIRMPTWFKKKLPVEVPSFPVKTGPIKHAEDFILQQPNI